MPKVEVLLLNFFFLVYCHAQGGDYFLGTLKHWIKRSKAVAQVKRSNETKKPKQLKPIEGIK